MGGSQPIYSPRFPQTIPPDSEGFMNDQLKLAEAVRSACLEAALRAYEDAGISGLCHEGRWEYAVQAIKGVDLTALLKQTGESADRNA
jgi:hypothetical protein